MASWSGADGPRAMNMVWCSCLGSLLRDTKGFALVVYSEENPLGNNSRCVCWKSRKCSNAAAAATPVHASHVTCGDATH